MAKKLKKTYPANSVFSLPAYRIGPYEMCVVPATRDIFIDKRRKVENDWTNGKVYIDYNVSAKKALTFFMRHLVTAIHYRSGLNDKSNEESFTHSLSTGLVEIARTNPDFWEALNFVLEETLKPQAGWLESAGGMLPEHINTRPECIRYNNRVCEFKSMPHSQCEKEGVYGYYTLKTGPIELSDGLSGPNLAIVAIHEVLHFLHECEGLKDKTTELVFKRTQVRMFMKFIKMNPEFWSWWLSTVNPYNNESVHEKLRLF